MRWLRIDWSGPWTACWRPGHHVNRDGLTHCQHCHGSWHPVPDTRS